MPKLGWQLASRVIVSTVLLVGCDAVPVPPAGEAGAAATTSETLPGEPPGENLVDPAALPLEPSPSGASLGSGFLVWESNRTGKWRIWTRSLEGGEPHQLTPNERGRQHYAPHISPDGRSMVYLSSTDRGRGYPQGGAVGTLRLVSLADGETSDLVAAARTYFENRAAVWRTPSELVYIGEDFKTRLLNLASGESRLLTTEAPEHFGYLVDASLGHASTNSASFSIYDADRRRVVPRANLGGCQPYFSHDGRWGVWVAGAGGPVQKMDLESRLISKLLDKNDARLPDGWGYFYFPMPSRDGSLLALAASRNQHDHFKSDYEVFVFETDPATLEPIGPPLRYTWNEATDRYPDVYRTPLALGRHAGEAPLGLELESPNGKAWQWSLGDGTKARRATIRHRYSRPGRYEITARRKGIVLRGQVVVAPPRAPAVVATRLSGDARSVAVEFDEPVQAVGASVSLESGDGISGWRLEAGDRRMKVDLQEPLTGIDRLVLEGIEDLAQQPNRLARAELEIGPPGWPASRDGLVFVWQTGEAANLVPDPQGGVDRAVALRASGNALLDHHWTLRPVGGRFLAQDEDAARVKQALQHSNEMTVELTVERSKGAAPAHLVTFADARAQNFKLETRGPNLFFHLRTGSRGPDANRSVDLGPLQAGRPVHLVLTYSPADLRLFVNGRERVALDAETIQGDFFHWRFLPLAFGGGRDPGLRLEGLAIFDRVLDAEQIRASFERSRTQAARRPEVPRVVVEARLLRRTAAPTLEQISPYREALVVFEYEVTSPSSGGLGAGPLRVAHWSILDGERLTLNDRVEGRTYSLLLEPFDANPQLASLYLGQAEGIDGDLPLYHAPSPLD